MKTAIYPGSFDPITNGHLDIIKRALKLFDRLIVAVGANMEKNPLFSVKEREELISESTKGLNVEIDSFDGLLVDYAKKKKITTIVRSLRALSDFEYEFQMAVVNRKLAPDMESVFLMTDKDYFFLNSSVVKQIAMHHGNVSCFVPKNVEKKLKEKFL
jgi:pantetheine-phosphate adenylyltransferase